MPRETSVTHAIVAYIKQIGGYAEKVKGDSSASGRPDINACYKGRCIRIEVKTPDNRNTASRKQRINLIRWKRSGAVAMVVYSKHAVENFISYLNAGKTGLFTSFEPNGCVSSCCIPKVE